MVVVAAAARSLSLRCCVDGLLLSNAQCPLGIVFYQIALI
jgi:hypothetical protein